MRKVVICVCVLAVLLSVAYAQTAFQTVSKEAGEAKDAIQMVVKQINEAGNTRTIDTLKNSTNFAIDQTKQALNATLKALGINNAAGQAGAGSASLMAAAGCAAVMLMLML